MDPLDNYNSQVGFNSPLVFALIFGFCFGMYGLYMFFTSRLSKGADTLSDLRLAT